MILGRDSGVLMLQPDGRSISFLPGRGLGSDNICIAKISLIPSPMDLLADVDKLNPALVDSHRRTVYTLSRDNGIATPRTLHLRLQFRT